MRSENIIPLTSSQAQVIRTITKRSVKADSILKLLAQQIKNKSENSIYQNFVI